MISSDWFDCPVCGSSLSGAGKIHGGDLLHGVPGEFGVLVCMSCGSGTTVPTIDEPGLGALYPEGYYAFAVIEGRSRLMRAITALPRYLLRRLRVNQPPISALASISGNRLLDVGGGRGDLGVEAKAMGWNTTVLDPSDEACAAASARGLKSYTGTLAAPPAGLGSEFDAVVFNQSLEHVADPLSALRAASERLRPGGTLIASMPNFGCRQARWFGSYWFHLDLPRHRSHFTQAGIVKLSERAELPTPIISTSMSTNGLPMSLLYRWFGHIPSRLQVLFSIQLGMLPVTVAARAFDVEGDTLHAVWRFDQSNGGS